MSVLQSKSEDPVDSAYAWRRLLAALVLSTIGGVGIWSVVVALPVIEAEFGVDRSGASLPYTVNMIGFAVGAFLMGKVADRFGIMTTVLAGALMLSLGYFLVANAQSLTQFIVAHAVLIGLLGTSPTFGPLVADISHWFSRRRGIAVAIVASGNYLAGTIWPPFLQMAMEAWGWRAAHMGIAVIVLVTMVPLSFLLRRRPDIDQTVPVAAKPAQPGRQKLPLPLVQGLMMVAGFACCVAMAMPQVHIVAYCADLGFGTQRGAEMLSLMLGFGVLSRLASGFIADRIGGLGTLLVGSGLQCAALFLFLPFDGLVALYGVSILFGLSQGGIVPSYALIVRDFFPARQAGARIGLVLMCTVFGMAAGGWISGEIYDRTGSYEVAFISAIGWNLLNLAIALWLLMGKPDRKQGSVAASPA